MPQNLENDFLQQVRKLKQKKRKRMVCRAGVVLLIFGIVNTLIYLFYQGNFIWKIGSSSINNATVALIILALIVICALIIFIINRSYIARYQFSLFIRYFNRFKHVKPKYILGYSLVILALIYQTNQSFFINQINGLVTHIVYKPVPPTLNSPWPWKDNAMIHPIVANMPSNIETSIESVAKYIAQNESDPYLRVKAIHDYVVSRVSYDLEVLKTGKRPPQDAKTVFLTYKAVCEGYANLFMALGRAIGTDVVYIRGKIRRDLAPIELIPQFFRLLNSGYDWTNHAWNAVKILDNWQLVDTTWDDSESSEFGASYSADYLTLPPEIMSISHFPNQLDWQLLANREDYNTFENKPLLTPQFFIEGLKLISPTVYQTNVQKVGEIKIVTYQSYDKKIVALFTKSKKSESSFWNFPESGNLLKDNEDSQGKLRNIKKCQTQANSTGDTEIYCQFPEAGDYEVFVLSLGKKVNLLGQLKFHALLH
ncbi:MAG: transglutaminase domain-containing protein [Nostoc sp. ChiSLP02]|nr:transglutaminase domain-containing protein [Nostoc sp. DedSLP05]MDZ8102987.1 transglutaminase domain-containing protein [Nostoc sp. DedSLP01]MDZ8183456.1 transglutaminase domain-containing protein [Nostoc sp. ChiSLP02]